MFSRQSHRTKSENRYQIRYAIGSSLYRLYDTVSKRDVFTSDSKVEVITEAQRRNGFQPVDGDENTYAEQTRDFTCTSR
jgi:hypothetical protein